MELEPSPQQKIIVVVDDDPEVLSYVGKVLAMANLRFVSFNDPGQALAYCGRENVALLLTDVTMPGMSGLRLSEKFSILQPTAKTLFMSGYLEEMLPDHATGAFLAKPFGPQLLLSRLQELL